MTQSEHVNNQVVKCKSEKRKLEITFARDINALFAEYKRNIREGHDLVSVSDTLKRHYIRVVKAVSGRLIKDMLNDRLRLFMDAMLIRHSGKIDTTTRQIAQRSRETALQQLITEGMLNPSEQHVNIVASRIFYRLNIARKNTIIDTETQQVVESVRREVVINAHRRLIYVIENGDKYTAEDIYRESGSYTAYRIWKGIGKRSRIELFRILDNAKKSWMTADDGRVRRLEFNHVDADGQTVPIDEPFIVSEETLMYPGDGTTASLGNIIRCRCISVYL